MNHRASRLRRIAALAPLVSVVAIAGVVPFCYAVVASFHIDLAPTWSWAGLSHYGRVFTDRALFLSAGITLLWALLAAGLALWLGFVLAVRVRSVRRGWSRLLYLFILVPWAVPVHIAVPMWRALLYGDGGRSVVSLVLGVRIDLMNDPIAAFIATAAVAAWLSVPLVSFVFISAFSSVPVSAVEAARIDGADEATIVCRVYLPLIHRPAVAAGLLLFLKGLREFSVVYLMTAGGPPLVWGITERTVVGATTTLGVYLFDVAQRTPDLGLSAAYSVVIALGIGIVVFLWLRARRPRRVRSGRSVGPARDSEGGARRFATAISRIGEGVSTTAARIGPVVWRSISGSVTVFYVVATFLAVYLLVWMSLSRIGTAYFDGILPRFLGVSAYRRVLVEESILRYFWNSFRLGLVVGILTPCIALPAAYLLSERPLRTQYLAVAAIEATAVAGGIHLLVPLYAVAARLGLVDTYVPLVFIYAHHAVPLALLLLLGRLPRLPASLRETMLLEGAGRAAYLRRVVVPLTMPVLVTIGVVALLAAWNGFVAPLLFVDDDGRYTVSVKLVGIVGTLASGRPRWNLFAAGSVVNLAVISLLLFRARKSLVRNPLEEVRDV